MNYIDLLILLRTQVIYMHSEEMDKNVNNNELNSDISIDDVEVIDDTVKTDIIEDDDITDEIDINDDADIIDDNEVDTKKPSTKNNGNKASKKMNKNALASIFIVIIMITGSFYAGILYGMEDGDSDQVIDKYDFETDSFDNGATLIRKDIKMPEDSDEVSEVTITNDTISFDYSTDTGAPDYSEGDIITGTEGEGYLRKIINITDEDGKIVADTEPVGLDEVILKGEFNASDNLMIDNGTRGWDLTSINHQEIKIETPIISGVISTKFYYEDFSAYTYARYDWGLKEFTYSLHEKMVLEVDFNITLKGEWKFDPKDMPGLFPQPKFNSFTIWLGGVPLVMQPQFEWGPIIELAANGEFKTGVKITVDRTSGLSFRNGKWTDLASESRTEEWRPMTFDFSFTAKLGIYADFEILLYGAVGPFIRGEVYFLFTWTPTTNPTLNIDFVLDIYAGLRFKVEFNYWSWSFWGGWKEKTGTLFSIEHSMHIFNLRVDVYDSPYEWPPEPPNNLRAEVPDPNVEEVWLHFDPIENERWPEASRWNLYRNGERLVFHTNPYSGIEVDYIKPTFSRSARYNEVLSQKMYSEDDELPEPGEDTFIIWGRSIDLFDDGASEVVFIDKDVEPGETYIYHIIPSSYRGEGNISDFAVIRLPTNPSVARSVNAIPNWNEVSPGNYTNNITITWQEPYDDGGLPIMNYLLEKGTQPDFTAAQTLDRITLDNVTSYIDTDIENGLEYYYRLQAYNGNFWSDVGDEVNCISNTPPGQIINLSASSGDDYVNLTWTAPDDDGGSRIVDYKVVRQPDSKIFLVGDVSSFNDTSVINGVIYTYSVIAINEDFDSTAPVTVSSTPLSTPSAPYGLNAVEGVAFVDLSWSPPLDIGGSPVTNYRIYRGTTPGNEVFLTQIGDMTNYNDPGLVNGQTYYYKVSAINIVGESGLSVETSSIPRTVPDAPQTLTVTAGDGYADLSWSAPAFDGGSSVTGHRIYRGTAPGNETFLVQIGNTLGYNDTAVANGQVYYYQVTAVNVAGEGALSNEASDTPGRIPDAPQTLTVNAGDSYATLDWLAPAFDGGFPVTNYRIYRGTSPGGCSFLTEIGNSLTFNDTSVTNGQIYYYQVSAVNSEGEGSISNEASDTPLAIPSSPLTPSTISGDQYVELSWTVPADNGGSPVTNYRIYRGTSPGGETFLIEIGDQLSYNDTALANGQIYYYRVSAKNVVGEGAMSTEVSDTPLTIPNSPQSLVAVPGDTIVDLNWNAPAIDGGTPVTNYNIYRGTSPGTEVFLTQIGPVTTYNDNTLVNGQVYYYQVSAVNVIGEGTLSGETSAIPVNVPGSPLNPTTTDGDEYVDITWDAPSDIGGTPVLNYRVYRGTSPGTEVFLTQIGDITNFNDTGLVNGQSYYYQISAVNAVGEGSLSTETNGTARAPPDAPTDLVAIANNGGMNLTWQPPLIDGGFPVLDYSVYRGTSPGSEVFLASVGGPITSFDDSGLVNGQIYYYKVTASNIVGESGMSNEASDIPKAVSSEPLSLSTTSGAGYVELNWLAPSDPGGGTISNYNIYRGMTEGGEMFLAQIGNVTTYNNTGLINGDTYYYKVAAVNEIGTGPMSNGVNDTPLAPPSEPYGLTTESGDEYVNITWQVPSLDGGTPITGYRIYRGTSPGVAIFLTQIGNVLYLNDTGLTNGITYYYNVSAVNAISEGALSLEANDTPHDLPTAPQTLSAIAGDEYVNLTWTAPADLGGFSVTNYKIYKGTGPGAEVFLTQIGNLSTFTDTAINGWTTYYYKVSAVTSIGEGPLSNEANDSPNSKPDAPSNLAEVSGVTFVNLTWDAPLDGGYPVTNYNIYRGNTTGTETYLATVGVQLYYNDSALDPWDDYYYTVSAINLLGEGLNSSEIFGVPQCVPYAPQNLAGFINNMMIDLTWDDPAIFTPIDSYYIYRGNESGNLTYYDQVSYPDTTYTDENPIYNQKHFYAVAGINIAGVGALSNEDNITVSPPIGPISIDGDIDFAAQAVTNSWAGAGVPGDPYIIENVDIDSTTGDGITIMNTNVDFIIRYVNIFGDQSFGGITLINVNNGAIENTTIDFNFGGIILDTTTNIKVRDSRISNNTMDAIMIFSSSNIDLIMNNISNSATGIMFDTSNNINITFNDICNNSNGVMIDMNSNTNQIFYNNFIGNTVQAMDEDMSMSNMWDDMSFGGNYWSDYVDVDSGPDGVWDNPYFISGAAGAMDTFALVDPVVPP